MAVTRFQFEEACASGALLVEDWCEGFLALISDPEASNRDVLAATRAAGRSLAPSERQRWLDDLVEFALWESGRQPGRLALCDHVVRSGLAPFDPPWRWRSGPVGGLLHIACEGASYEGVLWALRRGPRTILRRGGSLGVSVAHTLANRSRGEEAARIWGLLRAHGARADALTDDGRSALFRCDDPELASELMRGGADPWLTDARGFAAGSFWLESGNWDCARLAFEAAPWRLDAPIPWGEISSARSARPPLFDRPLFVAACSPALRMARGRAGSSQTDILEELVRMGADPLALDSEGRSLHQRSANPVALALQERSALAAAARKPRRRSARRARAPEQPSAPRRL